MDLSNNIDTDIDVDMGVDTGMGMSIRRQARGKFRTAILLVVLGWTVFSLFSWDRLQSQSSDPHFVLLADSFLKGSLELTSPPPHQNDWASYKEITLQDGTVLKGNHMPAGTTWGNYRPFKTLSGEIVLLSRGAGGEAGTRIKSSQTHYFVSFPPFPAVLMTPLVALFGTGFSDVIFTIFLAGINLGLVFLCLRKLAAMGHSVRTIREDTILVMLLGFGTAYLWCSVLGQVWFTAQIIGVGLTALYVLACLYKRPFWAGLALACAMSTRPHLAFAVVFFLAPLLLRDGKLSLSPFKPKLKAAISFAIPVLGVGIMLMLMNYARFGNPFEFGHNYLAAGNNPHIKVHGLFSHNYLFRNLTAAFLLVPEFSTSPPYVQISKHGLSLFLTTPALIYLIFSIRRRHKVNNGYLNTYNAPAAAGIGAAPRAVATPQMATAAPIGTSTFIATTSTLTTTPTTPVEVIGATVTAESTVEEDSSIGISIHSQQRPGPSINGLLWLTVAVLAIPQLFYHNTGFEQFGYRFSLDYIVYLIILLAVGRFRINRTFIALCLIGFLVNGFGAVTFKRFPEFFTSRFITGL